MTMKKPNVFTILSLVKVLVSGLLWLFIGFSASASTVNSTNTSKTQIIKPKTTEPDYIFSAVALISRSTSLVDHKDGTRTDRMDYGFLNGMKTPVGIISTKLIYSQNLNDMSPNESRLIYIPITFSFNPFKYKAFKDSGFQWTPSITAIAPAAKESVKRDHLQSILSTGLSFAFVPNQTSIKAGYGWSFGASISLGRYFHPYEEDINGAVLNQYSSNQTLNALYRYMAWSFSAEFIHKNRWTYQNNLKESFEHAEEIGYNFSPHFALAIGHTNAGSALKSNGVDTNYELVNENDSKIYGQMAISF